MASREELELRKLELEIKELSHARWLRGDYLRAFVPVVLTVGAILTGWLSGYFSNERLALRQETAQLRADRDSFKSEREHFQNIVKQLVTELTLSTERIKRDNEWFREHREPRPEAATPPKTSPSPKP